MYFIALMLFNFYNISFFFPGARSAHATAAVPKSYAFDDEESEVSEFDEDESDFDD